MGSVAKIAVPLGIALALVGLLLGWSGYLPTTYANALELFAFILLAGGYGLAMYQSAKGKSEP